MPNAIERVLKAALAGGVCYIGQIAIRPLAHGGFVLSHRDDQDRRDLSVSRDARAAIEIAKLDEAGNYRPLKTAPNLRRGWQLEVALLEEVRLALDFFYPGRLALFATWQSGQLRTTSLRETLDRQSGMYRIAARISDEQIDESVGDFCRSDGGCLRTIFWKRDPDGAIASTRLPPEKFEAEHDQTGQGKVTVPLVCQEACNLFVAKCREVVKMEGAAPSAPE